MRRRDKDRIAAQFKWGWSRDRVINLNRRAIETEAARRLRYLNPPIAALIVLDDILREYIYIRKVKK